MRHEHINYWTRFFQMNPVVTDSMHSSHTTTLFWIIVYYIIYIINFLTNTDVVIIDSLTNNVIRIYN